MPSSETQDGNDNNSGSGNELSNYDGSFDSPSMDTYPHIKEIRELRQQLGVTLKRWPEYDTIYSLQRWLQNQQYNVGATVPHVEFALNTIACLGGFDHHYEKPEDVCHAIRNMIPTAPYFPGGVMGFDKNGNIVSIQPVGRVRPKSLMLTGRVSDLYKLSILECEGVMQVLRKEEMRRRRKLGVIIIYDIAEYSTSVVTMSSVKIYLNNIVYLSKLFPDSISKVYVINAPAAINIIVQMAKHLISQKTFQKVHFLDHNWKQFLRDELGDEFLLPFWGGSKIAESPTGLIRMGGELPQDVKEKAIEGIKRMPEDKLNTIKVSARNEVLLPVEVNNAGCILSWYFNVDSGDIDFSISFNDHLVWPVFRISTEFVPEYGEITCSQEGTYHLHMNNHHSTFRGKTISYNVQVTNGDENGSSSGNKVNGI